jgi:hypothetical protein
MRIPQLSRHEVQTTGPVYSGQPSPRLPPLPNVQVIGARVVPQKSFASAAQWVCPWCAIGDPAALYVLCTEIESAQYSLHVLGVVLDGRTNTCYVCDPNGYFKPGSGLEYLHLPLQESPNPANPNDFELSNVGTQVCIFVISTCRRVN